MKTPLPEALEKIAILTLKLERLPGDEERPYVKREHDFYTAVIDLYRLEGVAVDERWLQDLVAINGRIWDVEASIRQGHDAELGLEEIGRRALKIRTINKERIEYKNKVARELGMDFFEIKIDHASE